MREFLPSGESLLRKIHRLRVAQRPDDPSGLLAAALAAAMHQSAAAAFPGSSHQAESATAEQLIRTEVPGATGFCLEPLADGMMAIYRYDGRPPHCPAASCPIRIGKVLQVVLEDTEDQYVVLTGYWPLFKPEKHGPKINLFGTWVPASEALPRNQARRAKVATKRPDNLMVKMSAILAWPVDLEAGNEEHPAGGRLPFTAFHFLRAHRGVDLSTPEHTFTHRGHQFYEQVLRAAARHLRQGQASEPPVGPSQSTRAKRLQPFHP